MCIKQCIPSVLYKSTLANFRSTIRYLILELSRFPRSVRLLTGTHISERARFPMRPSHQKNNTIKLIFPLWYISPGSVWDITSIHSHLLPLTETQPLWDSRLRSNYCMSWQRPVFYYVTSLIELTTHFFWRKFEWHFSGRFALNPLVSCQIFCWLWLWSAAT